MTNSITIPQLLEVVSTVVLFQFKPQVVDPQETDMSPIYYNKLNSWLAQILQRDIDNIDVELCEIEQHGIAIRICPLESTECPPTSDDIDNVIACLEQQMVSYNKIKFKSLE